MNDLSIFKSTPAINPDRKRLADLAQPFACLAGFFANEHLTRLKDKAPIDVNTAQLWVQPALDELCLIGNVLRDELSIDLMDLREYLLWRSAAYPINDDPSVSQLQKQFAVLCTAYGVLLLHGIESNKAVPNLIWFATEAEILQRMSSYFFQNHGLHRRLLTNPKTTTHPE